MGAGRVEEATAEEARWSAGGGGARWGGVAERVEVAMVRAATRVVVAKVAEVVAGRAEEAMAAEAEAERVEEAKAEEVVVGRVEVAMMGGAGLKGWDEG